MTDAIEDTRLWCMHISGMDDVHPAPDRATAQLWAAEYTAMMQVRNPNPHPYDPVMNFIVCEWPWSAEEHANGLEASISTNTRTDNALSHEHQLAEALRKIAFEQTEYTTGEGHVRAIWIAREALATYDSNAQPTRCKVPEGQTPLDDNLRHKYLDVINEGAKARDNGTGSPYHGHSLEHCLHAVGWVERDLRLALDKATDSNALDPATVEHCAKIADATWEKYAVEPIDWFYGAQEASAVIAAAIRASTGDKS